MNEARRWLRSSEQKLFLSLICCVSEQLIFLNINKTKMTKLTFALLVKMYDCVFLISFLFRCKYSSEAVKVKEDLKCLN